MALIITDIENLGVSEHYVSIVAILCHLYRYPTTDPHYTTQFFEYYSSKKLDDYKWLELLTGHFGKQATKTFVEVVRDITSMPENEKYELKYILEDMAVGTSEQYTNPEESAFSTSELASSLKSSKKPYLRLLGKIAPDLAAQNPRGVLPVLFEKLAAEDPEKYSPENLAKIFSPLVDEIRANDDQVDNLHRIVTSFLENHQVDPKFAKQITDELIIYQIGNPHATQTDLYKYIEANILPHLKLTPEEKITKDENDKNPVVEELTTAVTEHEEARQSDPEPDKESAKEYVQKLEQKTQKEIAVGALVVLNEKTGRYVLTDYGRAMADRFALSHLKGDNFDLDKALAELKDKQADIKAEKDKKDAELKVELAKKPLDKKAIEELYKTIDKLNEERRYLNLAASSIRTRKIHIKQKLLPKDQKMSPLENELVAQFTSQGLSPNDARKAARELLSTGLAVAAMHLSSFATDFNYKNLNENKSDIFSRAFEQILHKYPKLKDVKLNFEKFQKVYNTIPYYRDLLLNTKNLAQIFNTPEVINFFQSYVERSGSKVIQTALSSFLKTGIGQQVAAKITTALIQKVGKKAAESLMKFAIEGSLEAAGVTTGGVTWIILALYEVGKFIYDKLIKPLVTKAKIFIKRRQKEAAAVAAMLITGILSLFAPGIGVGAVAAAGIVTYGLGSLGGMVGQGITGKFSSSTIQGANRINYAITTLIVETAKDSFLTIFLVVLATPVVIAFILLIITSSAYVVPQETKYSGGLPTCWPTQGSIVQDPCGETCSGSNCTHQPSSGLNPGGLNAFDIIAPMGTPIYAAHNGNIVAAVPDGVRDPQWGGGYGNYVVIMSDDGQFATTYAHMPSLNVSVGQHVNVGDQIGEVDDTGISGDPHLHYELRVQSSGFTTDVNLCSGEWDIGNMVPPNWTNPGSTDYDGTCYSHTSTATP